MSLYDEFAALPDLSELPICWDALPYADEEFAREAVLDLSWQPGLEATQKECDLVVSALDLQTGASIVDVCCGPGRHGLELASRGYSLTGTDLSGPFVEYARAVAERRGLAAKFIQGDARRLAVDGPFDAALIMENTLSVFNEDDAVTVLRNIGNVLSDAGRLVCDLDNAEQIARDETYLRHWHDVPRGVLLQEVRYDAETGIQKFRDIELDLINGRVREFYICKRIYTVPELHRLFGQAGMRIVETFGDWDGAPHYKESPKTIVVAGEG